MDDLFQEKTFAELITDFETIAESLTRENELPERGIIVIPNKGKGKKNCGEMISFSIVINEPPYPATLEELKDEKRTKIPLLTIKDSDTKKWDGFVVLNVDDSALRSVPLPDDATLLDCLSADAEMGKRRVRFSMTSSTICDWVKQVVQWKITNFMTSADPFGCCDMFEKCSDAKKCLHPNRLYSTACAYRHNLEAGRVFYGKNKNV